MATPTTNLRLLKPSATEIYDLQLIGKNLDSVDTAFGRLGAHLPYDSANATDANVITMNSGYVRVSAFARRYGAWVSFSVLFTVTAGITMNTTGDLNITIGTVDPLYRSMIPSPLSVLGTGRAASGYIASNGNIVLSGICGTANVPNTEQIELSGIYMLDSSVV